ncbi:DUF1232 domain-containing protein [candidate division KSB1 bacterium]|nr:DUF1232 domain-containing protein [candidate division KSB1 bacterium]
MKNNYKRLFQKAIKNPGDALNFIVNLPKLIKLHFRLFKDARTPLNAKIVLVLSLIYIVSPIDLVPDLLVPIIGYADDIIILVAASRYFLKACPPQLVTEHIEQIKSESKKA